jgi:hypothetical protein
MRQPIEGRSETWHCGARTTKELIVDYMAEQVESFKLLGVHITNKLSWSKHTKTVVKMGQQHHFPLMRFGMGPQILKTFYSCTIESMLTDCITAWYGNYSASDLKMPQRVMRTAQYITGAKLPDIQNLYTRQCQRNAQNTPVTQLIDFSLYYRTASGTGVPSLGRKVSLAASTPKPYDC